MERIILAQKTTKEKMVVAPVAPGSSLAIAPLPAQTKFLWTGKWKNVSEFNRHNPHPLEIFQIFSIESYLLVF